MTTLTFDDEELQCLRVCVQNSPAPYNISKKEILKRVVEKVGEPIKVKHEGIAKVKYDLTPYGIEPDEWEKDLELCVLEMELTLKI